MLENLGSRAGIVLRRGFNSWIEIITRLGDTAMSNDNFGLSVGPIGTLGTPKGKAALNKLIQDPVVENKKKRRKTRLYGNYPDAFRTRSICVVYRKKGAKKDTGYVISIFRLDNVWYIQFTTNLARAANWRKDALDFIKDKATSRHIRPFLTVSYKGHSYLKEPPPENNVHDNSFVKYDTYIGWLPKSKQGIAFLKFLTNVFGILQQKERDFVPDYFTPKPPFTQHTLDFGTEIEKTSDANISLDPLMITVPETASIKTHEKTSFDDRLEEKLKIIEEQEKPLEMDDHVCLLEKTVSLQSQVDDLAPYRDGLAKAFFMMKGSEAERKEGDRLLKALMSLAVEDKAASGE